MTVSELIAELQKMPQDATVYRHDSEWNSARVTVVEQEDAGSVEIR